MKTYNLYVVAPDGANIKDSEHPNIESAQNESANLGSKWFFYPFHIITSGSKIIETGGSFYGKSETGKMVCLLSEKYKGRRLQTLLNDFKKAASLPDADGVNMEEFELILLNQ